MKRRVLIEENSESRQNKTYNIKHENIESPGWIWKSREKGKGKKSGIKGLEVYHHVLEPFFALGTLGPLKAWIRHRMGVKVGNM